MQTFSHFKNIGKVLVRNIQNGRIFSCNYMKFIAMSYSTSIHIDPTSEDVIKYFKKIQHMYANENTSKLKEKSYFNGIEPLLKRISDLTKEKDELLRMMENDDKELAKIIKQDLHKIDSTELSLRTEILTQLLKSQNKICSGAILEVTTGVGGAESSIFAHQLFSIYLQHAINSGWEVDVDKLVDASVDGLKKGVLEIKGYDVYNILKYEGGIHRVQRVPDTESSGRIHTSTVSVAVLPLPAEIDKVEIPQADMIYRYFSCGGPGGQNVNKSLAGVRGIHKPTGISFESKIHKNQHKNKTDVLYKIQKEIFLRKYSEDAAKSSSLRKLQVGCRGRSEKVRTYNYPQNRVTDHRINLTVHNINEFMMAGHCFKKLLKSVQEAGTEEDISEFLNEIK